jgi:hypothetical protein
LYVLCRRRCNPKEDCWEPILDHKSTLKRVVHHRMRLYFDPESALRSEMPVGTVLHQGNLKCLVSKRLPKLVDVNLSLSFLCLLKLSLKTHIKPCTKPKLLYVRVTGVMNYRSTRLTREYLAETAVERFSRTHPELFNFAHWASGSDGLPELQILAYGDFAFRFLKSPAKYPVLQIARTDKDST